MAWLAPLITGAASLIGGAFANRANARQAQQNRDWQERMSNTAAQRSRADYEAAGLNPALAYGHTAPMGGGAQAQQEDVVGKGIASAMAWRQHKAAIEQARANVDKTDAETALLNTERNIREVTEGDEPTYRQERIAERRARMRQLEHEGRMQPMTERHQQIMNRLTAAGIPEREVRAFIADDFGRAYRGATRTLPETTGAWIQAFKAWNRQQSNRAQFLERNR